MCMNRDENSDDANVQVMANELDRLLDTYKGIMDFSHRLDAADVLRKHYGTKVVAMDKVFASVMPKYKEMMADPELMALANRFMEFADRYNKGPIGGKEFDVYSFKGASLNEIRALVRRVIRSVLDR